MAQPHEAVDDRSSRNESRACLFSVYERPGGEPNAFFSAFHLAPPTGVFGTVPKGVVSNLHTVFDDEDMAALLMVELGDSFVLHVSRACLIAARESPGGEAKDAAPALGVEGIVSSGLFPKRQHLSEF